ncbi:MAG: TrkH family potassium uptake protein [Azospirillaceae bacterium]
MSILKDLAPPMGQVRERRGAPVLFLVGLFLIGLAAAMTVPMIADIAAGHVSWVSFAVSAAITGLVGGGLSLSSLSTSLRLDLRQAFLLTASAWFAMAVFASLPFHWDVHRLSFVDAFFEAMSGLTTTGSTVITGLDTAPPGLLLWRSMLEWIGGIGIIVMAIAILPLLKVGGMQLFRTESSDRSEKVVPSVASLALSIGLVYLGLTCLCAALLSFAGMTVFEAVNHAMTTVSTGGFSTSDSSMGAFSVEAQWIVTFFMIAGALPFVRYVAAVRGRPRGLISDPQVRVFLVTLIAVWLLIALWLVVSRDLAWTTALRLVAFNVTSVVTTTGFATDDYQTWGATAVGLFFLFTVLGGCSGSTSGGIKTFRFMLLIKTLHSQLLRLSHPNQVALVRYGGRRVNPETVLSLLSFVFVFVASWSLVGLALTMTGLDMLTAFSGAATALANVGPGLGSIIGPAGNFASLPDASKVILAVAMLLGRLEFFTVLVLFLPRFWRW